MSDKRDSWTRIADRALDTILAKHPARTGLGVILGTSLDFLVRVFEPSLKQLEFMDVTAAPPLGWVAMGILIMHIPTMLALIGRRPVGSEALDEALTLIERGNFSAAERRQRYRTLIDVVSKNIALSEKIKREVSSIESRVVTKKESSGK